MPKKKDLTGQKFGRLTVIRDTDERSWGSIVWECLCECGNKVNVTSNNLQNQTKSCGCLRIGNHLDMTSSEDREIIQATIKKMNDINSEKYWVEGTDLRQLNEKMRTNNSSGAKGVSWDKEYEKWVAYIGFKNKLIKLGRFENLEDAIKARKEAEEKYFKPIIEEFKTLKECTSL